MGRFSRAKVGIAAIGGGLFALAACTSEEAPFSAGTAAILGELGASCSANTDCDPAFACVLAHCRLRCSAPGDCGPGQVCDHGHGPPVCLHPGEEDASATDASVDVASPIDGATDSTVDAGTDAPTDSGADAAPPVEVAPGAPTVTCVTRIHGLGRNLLYSVASAPDGRIAVGGASIDSATIDFGAGPVTAGSGTTGFVAVYDAGCNLQWSKVLGPVTEGAGGGIGGVAFDGAGNLFVAGSTRGTFDFGSGPLKSKGDYDVAVAKYSATYAVVYAKIFGDALYQRLDGMAVDTAGNLVIGGTFSGTLDFGGGSLTVPSNTGTAPYLAKLGPTGAHVFSKMFPRGSAGGDYQLRAVDVSTAGDITVGGIAPKDGSIDLGAGPIAENSPGNYWQWVGRLDAAGNHVWSRPLGVLAGNMVGTARDGDVFFSATLHVDTIDGPIDQTYDFGNGSISGPAALVRLDGATGAAVWSRSSHAVTGAAGTLPGGAITTGSFDSTIDLGCGPLTSAGALDMFLARRAENGQCLYSMRFGDAKHQFLSAVGVTPTGATIFAGSYHGQLQLGATLLVNDDTRVTSDPQGDTEDAFVAVLSK